MVPWAILCALGLLAAIPVVFAIGIGAGAAQADWMSDGFVIGLVFVLPTILAIGISEWSARRAAGAATRDLHNS